MPWLLISLGATWALIGLTWVVQLVVYPAFANVGLAEFPAYHEQHCRRITWVVVPLMVMELSSALALVFLTPSQLGTGLAWLALALCVLCWAVTALFAVPAHAALAKNRDGEVLRELLRAHWARTVAWTGRGILLAVVLAPSV